MISLLVCLFHTRYISHVLRGVLCWKIYSWKDKIDVLELLNGFIVSYEIAKCIGEIVNNYILHIQKLQSA